MRVQVRDGKPTLIDGPFAEAKEIVGGFFLLDCETREQAIAVARECPAAEWATVEVREFGPCLHLSRARARTWPSTQRIHRTVEAVWRIESARIIAGLARIVRDVGLAEEFAQDALVAALEQWPRERRARQPGAWLTATAKHRAIDWIRRRSLHERKQDALTREIESTARRRGADIEAHRPTPRSTIRSATTCCG